MKKKLVTGILSTALLLSGAASAFADTIQATSTTTGTATTQLAPTQESKATNEITVKVNGEVLKFDQMPVAVQGRTLVPLRAIFEALGVKTDFDTKTGAVKATKGKNKVEVKIGSTTATVNGKAVKLEQKAQVMNQRTMVPLRFVSESFEATVKWDAATRTIEITGNVQKEESETDSTKTRLENALGQVDNDRAKEVISNNIEKQQSKETTEDTVKVTTPATTEITVKVNGKALKFDQKPVAVQGRTLVPLRAIFEALGVKTDFDVKTGAVQATKGKNKVQVKIGSTTATVNGKAVKLDQKAQVMNQRTMVPLRFISESFEANVKWDAATRTITITQK